MPINPPAALAKRDNVDKKPTPKKMGIYPPMLDPIIAPSMTIDLEDMILL